MIDHFQVILVKIAPSGNYLAPLGQIIQGENFVLQEELEENVYFRSEARNLGFGLDGLPQFVPQREVARGNRVFPI